MNHCDQNLAAMTNQRTITLIFISFLIMAKVYGQRVGISDMITPIHPSAIFQVQSTDKGLLIPRMTTADRMGVNAPATGLLVFDIDLKAICIYKQSQWVLLADEFMVSDSASASQHLYANESGLKLSASDSVVTLNEINHWQREVDTLLYEGGPLIVNDNPEKAAIVFDNKQTSINHSDNLIITERGPMNILLDANDDQTDSRFAIFNDVSTNQGDPVMNIQMDAGASWIDVSRIGIGTTMPKQRLDVNGGIRIGSANENSLESGTMRWNDVTQDFEGWNGFNWLSLTKLNSIPPEDNNPYLPTGTNLTGQTQSSPIELDPGDNFGDGVVVYGDTMIVGAPSGFGPGMTEQGAVHIYIYDGSEWLPDTILYPSSGVADSFLIYGRTLAFDGNALLVGALFGDVGGVENAGYVDVFKINAMGDWQKVQTITQSNPISGDLFGSGVEIDSNFAVIGGYGIDLGGKAFVYELIGGSWQERAILACPDDQTYNFYGSGSVSISGDYAVIGARGYDAGAISTDNDGRAYIFKQVSGIWSFSQTLEVNFPGNYDKFGSDASVYGQYLAVGCPGCSNSGEVYMYSLNSGTWELDTILDASSIPILDFGSNVDLKGDYLIASCYDANHERTAIIYHFNGNQWILDKEVVDPLNNSNSFNKVSTDGTNYLIGIPYADPNGYIDQGKVLIGSNQ